MTAATGNAFPYYFSKYESKSKGLGSSFGDFEKRERRLARLFRSSQRDPKGYFDDYLNAHGEIKDHRLGQHLFHFVGDGYGMGQVWEQLCNTLLDQTFHMGPTALTLHAIWTMPTPYVFTSDVAKDAQPGLLFKDVVSNKYKYWLGEARAKADATLRDKWLFRVDATALTPEHVTEYEKLMDELVARNEEQNRRRITLVDVMSSFDSAGSKWMGYNYMVNTLRHQLPSVFRAIFRTLNSLAGTCRYLSQEMAGIWPRFYEVVMGTFDALHENSFRHPLRSTLRLDPSLRPPAEISCRTRILLLRSILGHQTPARGNLTVKQSVRRTGWTTWATISPSPFVCGYYYSTERNNNGLLALPIVDEDKVANLETTTNRFEVIGFDGAMDGPFAWVDRPAWLRRVHALVKSYNDDMRAWRKFTDRCWKDISTIVDKKFADADEVEESDARALVPDWLKKAYYEQKAARKKAKRVKGSILEFIEADEERREQEREGRVAAALGQIPAKKRPRDFAESLKSPSVVSSESSLSSLSSSSSRSPLSSSSSDDEDDEEEEEEEESGPPPSKKSKTIIHLDDDDDD
jgi:hypothetical protein